MSEIPASISSVRKTKCAFPPLIWPLPDVCARDPVPQTPLVCIFQKRLSQKDISYRNFIFLYPILKAETKENVGSRCQGEGWSSLKDTHIIRIWLCFFLSWRVGKMLGRQCNCAMCMRVNVRYSDLLHNSHPLKRLCYEMNFCLTAYYKKI